MVSEPELVVTTGLGLFEVGGLSTKKVIVKSYAFMIKT